MDDKNTTPKINPAKLTPDQRDKLDNWQQSQDQLTALQDIADITQEVLQTLDAMPSVSEGAGNKMGSLLMDMRESLAAIKDKQTLDYAKPVVDAVSKLEKGLTSALKVTVDAPQVNVSPTPIDLSKVERLIQNDLPKAFDKAIKQIPKVDIPETNFQPLLEVFAGISEQLVSLENATRSKPQPGSIAINNTDANPVPITGSITTTVDTTGLATDTIQTDGTQKTQIVDAGGEAATVTGGKLDVNATASLAGTSLPISGAATGVGVAIVDGSGNQITSFGGGTQYTEDAAAAANPVGNMLITRRKDTLSGSEVSTDGDNIAVNATAKGEVYVKQTDAVPITDNSGSLTVDNGGTFAVQADVAKVNGTTTDTNSGSKSAGTQRVVLATDQPALTNALKVDGSAVTQPVSGTVSTTPPADVAPATQNVTVIDSASSTTTMANNQAIIIGTPTAGSAASFALSSIETVRVEVTGIWTGTIATETSVDGGTTWVAQGVHQGAYTTSSFTSGFVGGCNVSGATNFRVRATAAITGTAVVKIIESLNTQSVYIANAAPSGTVISALNSSTATLTSGSVYTGTGEDVTNFSEMRVSVFSDVASATDGLSLQQSSNGTNWDITDTYTVALSGAGQGKTYVVPRQSRFFRVVYTNGGTNQASFRLQTILNRTATAPSSQRAGDAYTNETDLVQNQAFLMGYNGTTWDRLRSDTTNGLDVDVTRLTPLVAGTAEIGNVKNSGTFAVQAAEADGANVTLGAKADAKSTATDTTAITIMSVLKQISASTQAPPSQAVTNAGTFAVQATLGAETTKVIGTVRTADGGGNLYTTNSTTYTAKFGQDSNILGTLGTAFSTAGKVDIKGADGDVFVRNATAANLKVDPSGVTSPVSYATTGSGNATGALRVEIANNGTGNISTVAAVTAITNALPTGTNSIGKVSDITTSVVPGTAATNLGKAEDAAHTTGDTGVFALAVRNDNLGTTYTNTDQDYSPFAVDLQGRTMVVQKTATATLSNVAGSATTVTLLAANASRIGAQITNDSSALLYIKFGTTASTTSYTVVLAGAAAAPFSYYEVPAGYTGRIDGIWASGTGNARVTEET